jgi:hypothetical protein
MSHASSALCARAGRQPRPTLRLPLQGGQLQLLRMLAGGGARWPPDTLQAGLSDALRASFGVAAADAPAAAAAAGPAAHAADAAAGALLGRRAAWEAAAADTQGSHAAPGRPDEQRGP